MITALLLALSLTAAAAPSEDAAQKAGAKVQALIDAGEVARAFKLASVGVRKAPDSPAAWRAMFFATVAVEPMVYDSQGYDRLLAATATRVMELKPDALAVGIAQTTLDSLGRGTEGLATLPAVDSRCPPDGNAAFQQAEQSFVKHDMPAARALYDEAMKTCSYDAALLVYRGDTWLPANPQAALADYDAALAVDPCYAQAHRFWADVALQVPEVQARGQDHAMRAVACDPGYDAAWATLGVYLDSRRLQARPRWQPSDDPAFWKAYQDAVRDQPGIAAHAAAVRTLIATQPPTGWLADALRDADATGRLEELILLDLLDEALVQPMLDERAARLSRLVEAFQVYHILPVR
jgi:hypothetical protein